MAGCKDMLMADGSVIRLVTSCGARTRREACMQLRRQRRCTGGRQRCTGGACARESCPPCVQTCGAQSPDFSMHLPSAPMCWQFQQPVGTQTDLDHVCCLKPASMMLHRSHLQGPCERPRLNGCISRRCGKAPSHHKRVSRAPARLESFQQRLPGVSHENVIKASISPGNMRTAHVTAALMRNTDIADTTISVRGASVWNVQHRPLQVHKHFHQSAHSL